MHPAIQQEPSELSGFEQFQLAVKNLVSAESIHEMNVANAFNSLNELQQQIWLKSASCPLVIGLLATRGGRVRKWSQLNKMQRNRMMNSLKAICAIAGAYQ